MSTQRNNPITKAIRFALIGGAAVSAFAPAFAADEQAEESAERIEITGSRIKRTDVEGANPVTTISRDELDLNADTNVQDFVQSLTQNSFGSFRPISGNSAAGNATANLRGLGSTRTLVLINGRRMAGSPVLGNGAQNLSTIPMSAVERIEVLADGSSAIYGSEAIGGVLNVILRDDFEGAEITAYGSDTQEEGGQTESGSIVGGSTFDKGNFVFAVDFERKDIIWQKDRDVTFYGDNNLSTTGPYGSFQRMDADWNLWDWAPGSAANSRPEFAYQSAVRDANGNFTGALSTSYSPFHVIADTRVGAPAGAFRVEGERINPNCPNDLLNPDMRPILGANRCGYRYPYNAAADTDNKRVGIFLNFNYDINDTWSMSQTVRQARFDSYGVYAPAPFVAGSDIRVGQPPIVVADGDPSDGIGDVAVTRNRPLALGNRESYATNDQFDAVTAFTAEFDAFSLDLGFQYNRHSVRDIGYNYALRDKFRTIVENGSFDPFNPANNTSQAALDAVASMNTTIVQDAETTFRAADATISGDLTDMIAYAVGAEFRNEDYFVKTDNQSNVANVFGSSGGSSVGERDVTSMFAEVNFRITDNFDITPAIRADDYSDVGGATTGKVSARWQPLESLVLRGSVGTGFRAPTLDDLFAAPSEGYPIAVDPATGIQTQYLQVVVANPNLEPEESEHINFGLVWQPLDNLSLSADYFDVYIENVITTLDINGLLALEDAGLPLPPPTQINRDSTGALQSVVATQVNSGELSESGIDLTADYKLNFDSLGTLRFNLAYSYLLERESNIVAGFSDLGDTLGLAGVPQDRAKLTIEWSMGDHRFGLITNYIASTKFDTGNVVGSGSEIDPADPFRYNCAGEDEDNFDLRGNFGCDEVGEYITIDAQYSWSAPWNGTVTVGGKNLTNEAPPANGFELRGFSETLYDLVGGEYYVRYVQRF